MIVCGTLRAQSGSAVNTITADRLSVHVYHLASAGMNGRATASEGEAKAGDYIVCFFTETGLDTGGPDGYLQYFPVDPDSLLHAINLIQGHAFLASKGIRSVPGDMTDNAGFREISHVTMVNRPANVIGIVPGKKIRDEYVILTAHYDHIGHSSQAGIYYGADDNASGVSALMEVARVCAELARSGKGPKRTMVFIAVSGEEFGYWGSRYYTENPVFPLEKTSLCLNMDMIGRIDREFSGSPDSANYVYVLGHRNISSALPSLVKKVNRRFTRLTLGAKFEQPEKYQRKLFASDQKSFLLKGVPVLFLSDGYAQDPLPTDYHQPTDTPDKINYDLLSKRAKLAFYLTWKLANQNSLLKRDLR